VETAAKRAPNAEPLHPRTPGLIVAVPEAKSRKTRRKAAITGEIPSALDPPKGCRFHTRCPDVVPICREIVPAMRGGCREDTQPNPLNRTAVGHPRITVRERG
jgi:oligopeptide transport system ATP-binding protein